MHTSSSCSQKAAGPENFSPFQKYSGYVGIAAAGALGAVCANVAQAEEESEHGLHAPEYAWNHTGFFDAFDHAAIRRGHQVYQQVCTYQMSSPGLGGDE